MALELAYRWFPVDLRLAGDRDPGPVGSHPALRRPDPLAGLADPSRRAARVGRPRRSWPWGQLWRVALPLSVRALAAAWCVAFVLGFGELPATNLVQPPGVTTITFRIWTLLHTGVESHLAGVALVTLAVQALAACLAVLGLRLLMLSSR